MGVPALAFGRNEDEYITIGPTKENEALSPMVCKNCGAPLTYCKDKIVCEYCGTEFYVKDVRDIQRQINSLNLQLNQNAQTDFLIGCYMDLMRGGCRR